MKNNDKNDSEYVISQQRTRVAKLAGEMSEEDIRQLEQTHMSSKHDTLNGLLESPED